MRRRSAKQLAVTSTVVSVVRTEKTAKNTTNMTTKNVMKMTNFTRGVHLRLVGSLNLWYWQSPHATGRSSCGEKLRPIDASRRLLTCDLSERATVWRHGDSRGPLHLPTNMSKLSYMDYAQWEIFLIGTVREPVLPSVKFSKYLTARVTVYLHFRSTQCVLHILYRVIFTGKMLQNTEVLCGELNFSPCQYYSFYFTWIWYRCPYNISKAAPST